MNMIYCTKTVCTYVEDLETSDIEHTDVGLPLVLGVEGLVTTFHQPAEHALVYGLGQSRHGVCDLMMGGVL